MLLNLLSNSLKFTFEGFIKVFAQELENGEIQIQIEDSGIGIRAKEFPSLFKYMGKLETSSSINKSGKTIFNHTNSQL